MTDDDLDLTPDTDTPTTVEQLAAAYDAVAGLVAARQTAEARLMAARAALAKVAFLADDEDDWDEARMREALFRVRRAAVAALEDGTP